MNHTYKLTCSGMYIVQQKVKNNCHFNKPCRNCLTGSYLLRWEGTRSLSVYLSSTAVGPGSPLGSVVPRPSTGRFL